MGKNDTVEITFGLLYLIMYNFAQALGWTALTINVLVEWMDTGSYGNIYEKTSFFLNVFQTLALFEIVHASVGLVKSNPVLTAFQIFSRVLVVWGILYNVPEVQGGAGFAMLITAWSITEIIRYSYYMCALVNKIPFFLQWLRYTTFIVLYPLGVSGELLSIFNSLGYVYERGIWTISLPTWYNMSFSYYHVLIAIMLTYIPVFPQLYLHMFAQRKKMNAAHAKRD